MKRAFLKFSPLPSTASSPVSLRRKRWFSCATKATCCPNTGSVPAETVAQLYVHQRAGTSSRPVRELKGFRKLMLKPRETQTVRFTLGKSELTYWSAASRSLVLDPGIFDIWVGNDSTASIH